MLFSMFFLKKTRTLMPLREMITPNHLTRFVNLTPTRATQLQKRNVLVMSKKELVPEFAMSRANIKSDEHPLKSLKDITIAWTPLTHGVSTKVK